MRGRQNIDFNVHWWRAGSEPGGRRDFERMVVDLCISIHGNSAYGVRDKGQGDGGADACYVVGDELHAWEAKYFIYNGVGQSQVRRSLKRFAQETKSRRVGSWTLLIPVDLEPKERNWWDGFSDRQTKQLGFEVKLLDAGHLRELLAKAPSVYRQYYAAESAERVRSQPGTNAVATVEPTPVRLVPSLHNRKVIGTDQHQSRLSLFDSLFKPWKDDESSLQVALGTSSLIVLSVLPVPALSDCVAATVLNELRARGLAVSFASCTVDDLRHIEQLDGDSALVLQLRTSHSAESSKELFRNLRESFAHFPLVVLVTHIPDESSDLVSDGVRGFKLGKSTASQKAPYEHYLPRGVSATHGGVLRILQQPEFDLLYASISAQAASAVGAPNQRISNDEKWRHTIHCLDQLVIDLNRATSLKLSELARRVANNGERADEGATEFASGLWATVVPEVNDFANSLRALRFFLVASHAALYETVKGLDYLRSASIDINVEDTIEARDAWFGWVVCAYKANPTRLDALLDTATAIDLRLALDMYCVRPRTRSGSSTVERLMKFEADHDMSIRLYRDLYNGTMTLTPDKPRHRLLDKPDTGFARAMLEMHPDWDLMCVLLLGCIRYARQSGGHVSTLALKQAILPDQMLQGLQQLGAALRSVTLPVNSNESALSKRRLTARDLLPIFPANFPDEELTALDNETLGRIPASMTWIVASVIADLSGGRLPTAGELEEGLHEPEIKDDFAVTLRTNAMINSDSFEFIRVKDPEQNLMKWLTKEPKVPKSKSLRIVATDQYLGQASGEVERQSSSLGHCRIVFDD